MSPETNDWTGLQRETERETEEGEISQLGETTKSYRGIISVRPEKRGNKSVPISTDGYK